MVMAAEVGMMQMLEEIISEGMSAASEAGRSPWKGIFPKSLQQENS